MNPASKRRRIITGCQACRDRHVRCDTDTPCQQCTLHNLTCTRPVNVRFRPSPSTTNTTSSSSSTRDTQAGFPTGQKWIPPPSTVQFYDETPEVARYYGQADWTAASTAPGAIGASTILTYSDAREAWNNPKGSATTTPTSPPTSKTTGPSEHAFRDQSYVDHPSINDSPTSNLQHQHQHQYQHYSQSSPPRSSPRHIDIDTDRDTHTPLDPVGPSPRQAPVLAPSPLTVNVDSPASLNTNTNSINSTTTDYRPRPSPSITPFTDREAELVRNFSENMALWADITDIHRHFELEVPRRALFNLIIRYAVCAFSSRHMNRAQGDEGWAESESLHYHNKCLEMLIPILSNLDHELTEDVLAAVAILRLDEEMEKQDNCFHLQGITRILNQITTFCTSNPLGEATSWLCLRQEIYVSLVSQQPLRTNITNFSHSTSLQKTDDPSWANRIVLLLAQILNVAFLTPSSSNDARLKRLDERVDSWMRGKPPTFEPIRYVPRDSAAKADGNRFPVIWMLHPFHVLGVQYYHIAKIVLAVSASQADPNKRYFFRWERSVERRVRNHILMVVGLAKSNPRAENTLFTARHTLTVWGNVLTRKADQEGVKEFLREMERKTGWTTSKLIMTLEEQWNDSDDNGDGND